MKRRDFLKILGACVVAPGTVIAAIKAKPEQRVYAVNYPGSGVTNAQLKELIQVTLKNLPPLPWGRMWVTYDKTPY